MSPVAILAQVPEVDPFHGIDFPVGWAIATLMLALTALYLWLKRRETWDQHLRRNYLIAAIVSAALAIICFDRFLSALFSSFPGGAGGALLVILAIALIAFGGPRR